MSYGFCSKFHTFSSNVNVLKISLRFDKVTASLKVGTFLRHSVYFSARPKASWNGF